ncbi:MAG TPA: alpha/beta hydrolase [Nitrososphaeraceae archaeon]|jgi:pimeloyl-ACP methyl ester carboxylesterase
MYYNSRMLHRKHNQKTKLLVLMCLSFVIVIAISSASYAGSTTAQNKTTIGLKDGITNVTKINIVLVHGLGADASSWSRVIPILLNAGHKVIAVQLPLHSLTDDIATVKHAIDLLGGPTILVGHSYGGMVISNAAYNNPSVKGLVYIAALAPKEGQSLSTFVKSDTFPKGSLIIDKGKLAYLNPDLIRKSFPDIDPVQADILAVTQKPFNISILAEKSGPVAWNQLPTWYQISENDHNLSPTLEHFFAKQMNATTISLPSSHESLISHSKEIAQLILNATKAVTR